MDRVEVNKNAKRALISKIRQFLERTGVSKKFILEIGNVFQLCHFTRVKISSTDSKILLRVPRIYWQTWLLGETTLTRVYSPIFISKVVESKNNDQQSERKTERTKCLVREAEGGNTLAPSPVSLDLLTRAKRSAHAPPRRRPR